MKARWLDSAAVVLTAISRTGRRALKQSAIRGSSQQHKNHAELVRSSSLFDADWYLATYPDVASSGVDPLNHYMVLGWTEGRDPGPDFATSTYLRDNPDVARSGTNPLVHYLEFGHSEGRGRSARSPAPSSSPTFATNLPQAAPCASFPLDEELSLAWRRSYRLEESRPDAIFAEGLAVGYAADPISRRAASEHFRLLRALSGCGSIAEADGATHWRASVAVIDAWYATQRQMRLRLNAATSPFVVRAFQHDPLEAGELRLVGEGLVTSALDFFDLHLANALFPILLAFAKDDGTLLGFQLLAFPSLCRGGQHYPELIALQSSQATPNIVASSDALCARLIPILRGSSDPLIERIAIDLEDADTVQAVFSDDLKLWLAKVMQVAVTSTQGAALSPSHRYLRETLEIAASGSSRGAGAVLILKADMVPTIGALVESHEGEPTTTSRRFAPMLLGRDREAQPYCLLEFSAELTSPILDLPGELAPPWPLLEGKIRGRRPLPPAAIRRVSDASLASAELIYPSKRPHSHAYSSAREPVTWLIRPQDWQLDELEQALQTLALQTGSGADAVTFVGALPRSLLSLARESLAQVTQAKTLEAAVGALVTDLAGFVGAGVMLHDHDTVAILSRLLSENGIASASCVILSTERQGRVWQEIKPSPPKFLSPAGDLLPEPEAELVTELLWGANYPVAAPSSHLWIARSSRVREWSAVGSEPEGVHFSSSQVTASIRQGAKPSKMELLNPAIPGRIATTAELFLG